MADEENNEKAIETKDESDVLKEEFAIEEDATWGEVLTACCVHSPAEWAQIFAGFVLLIFFLYFFLFGLDLLGSSAKVVGGCTAGGLFPDDTNPVGALMIGILATVFLQSSSTTTSIIVGLVGADSLSVVDAIYMVMGANIGTSVTNTIVSMGQMGDGDQLERAFAGATVHDCFNFLTVAVLFPVELITGYLRRFSKAVLPSSVADGEKWVGPLKRIVSPLTNKVIKANKNVIKDLSKGKYDSCEAYYPTSCEGGVISKKTCSVGLIGCDSDTNKCPAFFQDGATRKDDEIAGGVCLFLSLVILTMCLVGMVKLLTRALLKSSNRIMYKATSINPYLAILIGTGLTILVQSSSITTSSLTPLVGLDVLRLEQMLPLTLGANIGTTFTGLLAALVSSKIESLQVALCHLFFNITGIIIWFPVPFMRNIPLNAARALGRGTRIWRGLPVVYILIVFFAIPALFLGLSTLFEQGSAGFTALGSFITLVVGLSLIYFVYWYKYKGGYDSIIARLERREILNQSIKSLPSDIESLKDEIVKIKEHTGMD